MFGEAFDGKRVWLSGHTGFKGSWMTAWLLQLGAEVTGFSLSPPTQPSLFEQLGLAQKIHHQIGDVRDWEAVGKSLERAQPDFVFHFAAQPLVRDSYQRPRETFEINAMGTVHVLEGLRNLRKDCAAVFITSDKCYENREQFYGYREIDPLGGFDPYSGSKAVSEIVIHSYRCSFFEDSNVRISSARAGNVIGGGDWAADRILPDCIRALQTSGAITVRNKAARRPWQHVLEPLSGYLWLAAVLARPALRPHRPEVFRSAFNFGPNIESNRTVEELVREVLRHWPGRWEAQANSGALHEAMLLNLVTEKAHALLGWGPVWDFSRTVRNTVQWYQEAACLADAGSVRRLTDEQIRSYVKDAKEALRPWALEEVS